MSHELLEAVEELARKAGDCALEYFRTGVRVERKPDGSPVTIADRNAERLARDWITARFPKDGVLGEELGSDNPNATRQWIIDPIDGTKTFVRGVPLWGTLVAVAEGEQILAGAIYCPAVKELVCAAPGEGCWWNGERARVSDVSDISRATVLTTDERFSATPERRAQWKKLMSKVEIVRTWGDCYGYMLVATGRADLMADGKMSVWDAAALQPVITEAGGVFTDWTGRETAFGGNAIASNAALAREARALLCAG